MDMRIQRAKEQDAAARVSRGELRSKLIAKKHGIKEVEVLLLRVSHDCWCLLKYVVAYCRILAYADV